MSQNGRVYRTTRTISRSSDSSSGSEIQVCTSESDEESGPFHRNSNLCTRSNIINISDSDGSPPPSNSRLYGRTTEDSIALSGGKEIGDTQPIVNLRQYQTTRNITRGYTEDEETAQAVADIYPMKGFPYPAYWDNSYDMDVLMRSFRPRSVDVDAFDNKMKFWQDMISVYGLYKRSAVFTKRELETVFRRGKHIPYCLGTVLEEMLLTKQLQTRSEYDNNPTNTWIGWAFTNFINKPLTWGFSKIPFVGVETAPADVEYVHLDVVRVFCEEVENLLAQYIGQIESYEILAQQIKKELHLQEDCIEMCLETLQKQGRIGLDYIVVDKRRRIHLVKIPGDSDSSTEITQANRAVFNLYKTQKKLMQDLVTIENNIKDNEEKARQHVKAGKRQLAKTYLRKKLLLEKSHDKRSLALHNIETLICNVEEAQTNGVIMDAYKIGSNALQNLLNASGLKYDNVDEVISDVRETIDTHNELQESLANVYIGESITGSNDDELESELRKIVGEEATKTQAKAEQIPEASTPAAKVLEPPQRMTKQNIKDTQIGKGNSEVDGKVIESHQPAEISDAELLAMLEGLEVEASSPVKAKETSKISCATSEPVNQTDHV